MASKVTIAALVAGIALGLAGCAGPTSQQEADCTAKGGVLADDGYVFGSWWIFTDSSGPLYRCEVDGRITDVYNEPVTYDQSISIWYSRDKKDFYGACFDHPDPAVYHSQAGKLHYWVCVSDGKIIGARH